MPRPRKDEIALRIQRLAHGAGLPMPAYQSPGAAGLDLVAAVDKAKPLRLAPGARALIPTGLVLELPPGHEAQVRPRSGLALAHGLTVLNSPGTIDSDYRGEVMVLLVNLGAEAFEVTRGLRIAQLVVAPVARARPVAAGDLSQTERGRGGFGSTGSSAGDKRSAGGHRKLTSPPRAKARRVKRPPGRKPPPRRQPNPSP
jgi:dUTP pyrophosphatase